MNETKKIVTVGRRKEAIARVILVPGSGDITVNGEPCDNYFVRETDRITLRQPLQFTNTMTKYNIIGNINGGGFIGQAGAFRLGIARALIVAEPELKDTLRKNKCLTRDPRMKERKKYGLKGARKRFQWTKR